MKKHLYFFLILLTLIGCSKRPKELPPTFPCKIVIMKDGVPQADCDISLRSETVSRLLSITGRTDSSGVAEIRTQCVDYTTKGAPLGTYKVLVDKHVELPEDLAVATPPIPIPNQQQGPPVISASVVAKRAAELEKARGFSMQLSKEETTPFEFTLEKGGESQWTFDLKEHLN